MLHRGMVTANRIRLTGLLTKTLANAGVFYSWDIPKTERSTIRRALSRGLSDYGLHGELYGFGIERRTRNDLWFCLRT